MSKDAVGAGKSLSEALIFLQLTHNMTKDCSLNYQFSKGKFQAQNMSRTFSVHKLLFVLTFRPIHVHNMFLTWSGLRIFMNNLLSYCGLVEARISASKKDLPVHCSGTYIRELKRVM